MYPRAADASAWPASTPTSLDDLIPRDVSHADCPRPLSHQRSGADSRLPRQRVRHRLGNLDGDQLREPRMGVKGEVEPVSADAGNLRCVGVQRPALLRNATDLLSQLAGSGDDRAVVVCGGDL